MGRFDLLEDILPEEAEEFGELKTAPGKPLREEEDDYFFRDDHPEEDSDRW